MTTERLAELKEKYKDRKLLEELYWGMYADHSGYTSKQNGEFLNWLCLMAYTKIKETDQAPTVVNENLTTEVVGNSDRLARPLGEWIIVDDTEKFIAKCSVCGRIEDSRMVKHHPFCRCGAYMQKEAENE